MEAICLALNVTGAENCRINAGRGACGDADTSGTCVLDIGVFCKPGNRVGLGEMTVIFALIRCPASRNAQAVRGPIAAIGVRMEMYRPARRGSRSVLWRCACRVRQSDMKRHAYAGDGRAEVDQVATCSYNEIA